MPQKRTFANLLFPLLLVTDTALGEENTKPQFGKVIQLDTITINSNLLEQSAQESAESTEVFTEQALKNQAGLSSARDILDAASNVSFMESTGTAPTVRGVDGTGPAQNAIALFAGGRPRLNVEVDNRPVSFNELVYGDFSLFDAERVEALRGPQSTLVGRNAMAGTINIKTKDPKFEEETILRLATGNLGSNQLATVINRPITEDSAAFRLAIDWKEKDSATEYQSHAAVDNPGHIESLDVKSKLLLKSNQDNNAQLLISLNHADYSGPAHETVIEPYKDRVSNLLKQPQHNPETDTLSLDYSQDLSATLQFKVNTSLTDVGFNRVATENTTNTSIDALEYVLEPQIYYDGDDMSIVTGLYYYNAREEQLAELFSNDYSYKDEIDTLSAYSEGSLPLSDNVILLVGLRYEQEVRKRYGGAYSGGTTSRDLDYDETDFALLPKVHVNWRQSEDISWGAQISKGYNAGGTGFTLSGSTPVYYEYGDETSWTYEVYGRQQFMNGRLASTQNLFYSRYDDMQQVYSTDGDWNNDFGYAIVNAGKVNTWGAEIGLTAILSKQFTLSGSLALLGSEVVEFAEDTSLEGNELPTAPNITSRINLDWHREAWQASLGMRYSGSYYTYLSNLAESETDAYFVTDARLSYQAGNVEWFASIDNLLDEDDIIYLRGDNDAPSGYNNSAVLLQPRTLLTGVQYPF